MPYKIAVIYSAYPEMTEAAYELIQKKGYHVEAKVCVFDQAVQAAQQYEAEGFDLIISRGATGTLIQRAVSIPVILVEITNFDILQTLYRAKKLGVKMAYFEYVHNKSYHDFAAMREILGLNEDDLTIYYYQNEEELRNNVAQAFASRASVVVATGAFVLEMAKLHGMKTIMVHSTREAIYNAFKQAEDILEISNRSRDVSGYLAAMIDHLNTGIIMVNREGLITHINSAAQQVLDIDPGVLLRKNIAEVQVPLLKELTAKENGSLVRVLGQHEVVIHKVPLNYQDSVIGTAITFENRQKIQVLEDKIRKALYTKGLVARHTFQDIIGSSQAIQNSINKARNYARSDSTILITGESGTGKEVFANGIHNASLRAQGPFVAVNCATLPENLLESELFGYEEGAFTGARKGGKAGLFELAHHGTIFLDEVSEISLSTQARLLRVLQEKVIRRVGGDKIIPVDVRVIAATNADLPQKVREGKFREDLFFRLNVLNLCIPPLRERKEDIPLLISYFLKKHSPAVRVTGIPGIFMDRLKKYHWPGNVRELENFVEKFAILSQDASDIFYLLEQLYLDLQHFEGREVIEEPNTLTVELGTLKEMELQLILKLQRRFDGDKTSLARLLGISRSTLWSKLKELEE
ncbi:hypothetical protein SY88_16750 [Clostridiales bacterium PH28_bin88]|nr:hypothetical protein SY88_16750 [Clostridiales bacterium PH28_bin88]